MFDGDVVAEQSGDAVDPLVFIACLVVIFALPVLLLREGDLFAALELMADGHVLVGWADGLTPFVFAVVVDKAHVVLGFVGTQIFLLHLQVARDEVNLDLP